MKVAEIKLDIFKGCFDTTLEMYKPVDTVIAPVVDEVPVERKELDLSDLVDKFYEWTAEIKNINIDHSIDCYGVSRVIKKYGRILLASVAGKLSIKKWAVTTYKKRLNMLSCFSTLAVDSCIISFNPLLHVKRRR